MPRLTITRSLAAGLITTLVLAAGSAAYPYYDPPHTARIPVRPAPCQRTTPVAYVPGGVYRALVNELRQQGYIHTQTQTEISGLLVLPATGIKRCNQRQ